MAKMLGNSMHWRWADSPHQTKTFWDRFQQRQSKKKSARILSHETFEPSVGRIPIRCTCLLRMMMMMMELSTKPNAYFELGVDDEKWFHHTSHNVNTKPKYLQYWHVRSVQYVFHPIEWTKAVNVLHPYSMLIDSIHLNRLWTFDFNWDFCEFSFRIWYGLPLIWKQDFFPVHSRFQIHGVILFNAATWFNGIIVHMRPLTSLQ